MKLKAVHKKAVETHSDLHFPTLILAMRPEDPPINKAQRKLLEL